VLVAAGAAVLLAGCSAAQAVAEKVRPDHDLTTTQGASLRLEADPVGKPVITDHYLTSYVRTGTILQIATWDIATGDELWREDAAVGGAAPGIELDADVVKVGGKYYVPFLENAPDFQNDWLRIGIVDLATGREVQTTSTGAAVWAGDRPGDCDDHQGICFLGRTEAGSKVSAWQEWEYDLGTHAFRAAAATTPSGVKRMLGSHVFDNGVRSPQGAEELGYLADGKILWQRPYEQVFEAGYSSDWGWDWSDGDSADVIVGTGSHSSPLAADKSTLLSLDLTANELVGLDPKTGATRWKIAHAGQCPGRDGIEVDAAHVVACVYRSGSVSWQSGEPQVTDVKASLDVIEKKTGKITATFPLTSEEAFPLDTAKSSFAPSATSAPVTSDGKPAIADLTTGKTRVIPDGAELFCQTSRDELTAHRAGDAAGKTQGFNTGSALVACSPDLTTDADTSRVSLWAVTHMAVKEPDGYYAVNAQKSIDVYHLVAAKKK
jgi:outer membrane protein assembly factor BamB